MRGQAMERLVSDLISKGEPLNDFDALEFFAREGNWQTTKYYPHVRSLHAWEVDPQYLKALNDNLPSAQVRIGDSFRLSKLPEYQKYFNFIVLDNPQSIYGPNGEYCEHFEAIECALPLFKDSNNLHLVFNVNSNPFGYKDQKDWQHRRNLFYGRQDCSSLNLDSTMGVYRNYFDKRSFSVLESRVYHRDKSYLHYFYFKLSNM